MNEQIKAILDQGITTWLRVWDLQGYKHVTSVDEQGVTRISIDGETRITILPVYPNQDSFFVYNTEQLDKVFPPPDSDGVHKTVLKHVD